jgi:hypothetical protein
VVVEGLHGQDTTEHALVVSIEKTTNTGETSYTKDSQILQDGLWPSFARELESVLQSRIRELGRLSCNHVV